MDGVNEVRVLHGLQVDGFGVQCPLDFSLLLFLRFGRHSIDFPADDDGLFGRGDLRIPT